MIIVNGDDASKFSLTPDLLSIVNDVTCPVNQVVPVDQIIWEDVDEIKQDCNDCEW